MNKYEPSPQPQSAASIAKNGVEDGGEASGCITAVYELGGQPYSIHRQMSTKSPIWAVNSPS